MKIAKKASERVNVGFETSSPEPTSVRELKNQSSQNLGTPPPSRQISNENNNTPFPMPKSRHNKSAHKKRKHRQLDYQVEAKNQNSNEKSREMMNSNNNNNNNNYRTAQNFNNAYIVMNYLDR